MNHKKNFNRPKHIFSALSLSIRPPPKCYCISLVFSASPLPALDYLGPPRCRSTTNHHPHSSKPPNITFIPLFCKLHVSNLHFVSLDLFHFYFCLWDLSFDHVLWMETRVILMFLIVA